MTIVGSVTLQYIGFVRTDAETIPRHWSVSDTEGTLIIKDEYIEGLKDIQAGQRIVVIFHFHRSSEFRSEYLTQTPPNRTKGRGVFSICSPKRPNPIGMSVLEVISRTDNIIDVKGLDMLDGTPVLDIKPHVIEKDDCPSAESDE
jgi:tRNA-Thr(GGU) m(6)t(6)A37 methyltransferase TsaA